MYRYHLVSMSAALAEETLFVKYLLLTPHKSQAIGLLDLITLRQAKAISEIIYNVLMGSFSNTEDIKKSLKLHVDVLRTLSFSKFPLSVRRNGILASKEVVYKLLNKVKTELLGVISRYEGMGSGGQDEAETS